MAVAERRQREREARREAILDAAQQLITDVGYQAIRMDRVAEAAELSKGTLYLYFENKEALCAAVATRLIDQLLPVLERNLAKATSGLDAVRQLLQTYCDFTRENPHHFRFAISWLSAGERMDDSTEPFQIYRERVGRVLGHGAAAIERGQADGSIRRDIEPLQQAFHLWASMLGIVLVNLNKESIGQRTPQAVDLDGIMPLHVDAMARALASKEAS